MVPESTKASSVEPRGVPEPTNARREAPPQPEKKTQQPPTNSSVPSREGSDTLQQRNQAKFKAAQAKAAHEGVDSLTHEDIEGLTPEQLKELRGY